MADTWQQKALEIGIALKDAAKTHPEMSPLYTAWLNFARKRHLITKEHMGSRPAMVPVNIDQPPIVESRKSVVANKAFAFIRWLRPRFFSRT